MKTSNAKPIVAAVVAMFTLAQAAAFGASASKSTPGRDWPSVVPTPAIDVPMRDTAITQGPEGTWYLTGTLGVPSSAFQVLGSKNQAPGTTHQAPVIDFENSRQIKLWKSIIK